MARSAASKPGPTASPAHLRILNGNGENKDSAGRDVKTAAHIGFQRTPPVKPSGLSYDANKLWDQVIEQSQQYQLLKPLDGFALHVMAETYARWREAVRMRAKHKLGGKNSQGDVTGWWVGVEERAGREFRAWCAEFGFTPATESNLADLGGPAGGGSGDGDANPF